MSHTILNRLAKEALGRTPSQLLGATYRLECEGVPLTGTITSMSLGSVERLLQVEISNRLYAGHEIMAVYYDGSKNPYWRLDIREFGSDRIKQFACEFRLARRGQ